MNLHLALSLLTKSTRKQHTINLQGEVFRLAELIGWQSSSGNKLRVRSITVYAHACGIPADRATLADCLKHFDLPQLDSSLDKLTQKWLKASNIKWMSFHRLTKLVSSLLPGMLLPCQSLRFRPEVTK